MSRKQFITQETPQSRPGHILYLIPKLAFFNAKENQKQAKKNNLNKNILGNLAMLTPKSLISNGR